MNRAMIQRDMRLAKTNSSPSRGAGCHRSVCSLQIRDSQEESQSDRNQCIHFIFLGQYSSEHQSIQSEKTTFTDPPSSNSRSIELQPLPITSTTRLSQSSTVLRRASILKPTMLRISDAGRKSEGAKMERL